MANQEEYKEFIDSFIALHKSQLKKSKLPEKYWPSLCLKLKDEVFDAGNYFQICMRVDEDDELIGYKVICSHEDGLQQDDPNGVFLIDHAWTYRSREARSMLRENGALLDRMCRLMSIELSANGDESEAQLSALSESKVEAVLDKMWSFNQTYNLYTANSLTDEEREPLWYILDEFGSAIRHNDEPTVGCEPFFYHGTGITYTIMWPLKTLEHSDELSRDYLYGMQASEIRRVKMIPFDDSGDDYLEEYLETGQEPTEQPEPGIEYFQSGRDNEILPNEAEVNGRIEFDVRSKLKLENSNNNVMRVFTDVSAVRDHLDKEKFSMVDDIVHADIIFIRKHYKNYKELFENAPKSLINQFPYESVITVKDLLAIVCRRAKDSVNWLPVTYNLSYELPKFVALFKQREADDLDNHWILKPWNLARSIDTTVTKNLNQIIRLQETGPKIVQKYITDPVLFYREEIGHVKYDIRYIVMLRSINPLVIYTYKVFWLRFANKPYSLDHLDDYEKHFTVMNYRPVNLKQINCDEFVPMFEKQQPDFKWADVESKIFKMIRQVFEAACKERPPRGLSDNRQSRAMYAIDLMLDWRQEQPAGDGLSNGHHPTQTQKTIEPMICEINFMPDCTRACKYHPKFFNHVFDTLFLDNLSHGAINVI